MAIRSIFSTLLLYFLAHHNPVEGANVASHLTSDEVWEFRLPSPDQPDPPDELEIAAVTYGQGTFLVAGNYLGTSTDGKEWSFSSSPDFIQSAIWAGDRFLLAGRNGLFVSNEGVNAELVHQNYDFLFGLAYGKERSVVVGLEGKTLFSDDFILWTEGENEVSTNLFGAAYGGGRFVAVGANGTVIYSEDGQRWQPGDSGSTSDLFDVAYGDGRFIAVGQEVLWSKDGRNWLPEPAVTAETAHWGPFFRIEYACNVFVTTAWRNRILAREDGGKWYELLTGMSEGYKTLLSRNGVSIGYPWSMDIAYGHGTFIHAG